MRRPRSRYAAAAVLALALTACSGSDGGLAADDTSSPTPTGPSSSTPSGAPSSTGPDTSTSAGTPSSPTAAPSGGPADAPATVVAGTALLDWKRIPGSVDTTVTRGGPWTLRVDEAGKHAALEGPHPVEVAATKRQHITDAFLDGSYAVVVAEDTLAERGNVATVVDLASGRTFRVDDSSDVPTTSGGTWALGQGTLLHATVHRGAYCVATVDLASRTSRLGACVPPRHGFNNARVTPDGQTVMTFDDGHPSCRTVVRVAASGLTPLPGVTPCKGWDAALLAGGAIWSVVPKDSKVEAAHFYASVGDGYYDLGAGTSGSLVRCGAAAYFVRDPQRDSDPAQLMRWSPDGALDVVYESPGHGEAFLAEPRCGGDQLAVTALSSAGDEQVTAPLR